MFHRFYFLFLLACGVVNNSGAQICQGSLGDPIVNINFGAGPNPGPPMTAASTNYQYVNTDCPKDGYYAVRNRTEKCFDSTWFTVTDHTGNPDGYFMLVNASFAPGDFYLDTVRNLCPGSTYEFAAWLINVKRPVICWGASQIINPDITFRIERMDGTLLQSYNTGSIAATDPPQWKQYGFFFTTPAGVNDVVLRMVNNAPGGCGNDLGLDDITFRPCGPQVNASISGTGAAIDTACGGQPANYTLTAQVSAGYSNPVYQWQKSFNSGDWTNISGAISTSLDVPFTGAEPAGKYSYRILVAESGNIGSQNCRVASKQVDIVVAPAPVISAGSNSPVCEGGSIQLSSQGSNISWRGPNGFSASGNNVSVPNTTAASAGDYIATSTSGGCSWDDTVSVVISPGPVVTVNIDSVAFCQGDSVQLVASGATTYQWYPAQGLDNPSRESTTARPNTSVTYSVIGANGNGCYDTATVSIRVFRSPVADAGPDRSMLKGTTLQLTGKVTGDSLRYYWTPAYNITNENTLNPVVSPTTDTSYVLHVASEAGCGSDSDTVRVTIFKEIVVPNAFSPNGDGTNDRWNIAGLSSHPGAEVILFDRYGRKVLHTYHYTPWDGTRSGNPLPVATYYYVIDLRNGDRKLTGHVYLAR